jgi:hypothetical protein
MVDALVHQLVQLGPPKEGREPKFPMRELLERVSQNTQ